MAVVSRSGTLLAAVAVALAASASCATTSAPHSATQSVADQAAANSVYAALNADPVYFYRHVDVRVDDGVADLSGYVWSTDALYRARQIASAVPGITQVITSRLELERQGRASGRAR